MMATTATLHESLIGDLVEKGASKGPFKTAVIRAVGGDHRDGPFDPSNPLDYCRHCMVIDDFKEADCNIRPDAFQIDADNQVVTVYEVEVTHSVSHEKRDTYLSLWWLLDEYRWSLEVVAVDRFGTKRHIPMAFTR